MASSSNIPVEKLSIPVPYGFIAAKAWGNKEGIPVLALHGWQDNAGSFDTLIPLLPPNLYVVAFDAAGHGLSSHKPPGSSYNTVDQFVDIKRIVTYLGWNQFSIIAHSLGGAFGLLYSSMFPENVQNLVLLDMLKPVSVNKESIAHLTKTMINSLYDIESKLHNSVPVYSPEEAKQRLMESSYNELTPESAKILLKRGSQKSKHADGVVFTRDIRVRYSDYMVKFTFDVLEEHMKNLKCNLLIIRCKSSSYVSRNEADVQKMLKIYENVCDSFTLVELQENHFVHINKPEVIVPYINTFFKTHLPTNSKL